MTAERLEKQLRFAREIDRLKTVQRRSFLLDASRRENSAEHSWHLALLALLLREHAPSGTDIDHAVRLALAHDLVEIEAGDTFAYDAAGQEDKAERERRAADKVFGLLPPDQAQQWRALWDEFEARQTPESRYAVALDNLQPLMHNYFTQGRAWREHQVRRDQVLRRVGQIEDVSAVLWEYAKGLIDEATARGWLQR